MTIQILLGVLSGGKQYFLVAVVALAVVMATRGRFPWRSLLVALVLFVAVVVPFVTSYRHSVRTSRNSLAVSDGIVTAPEVLRATLNKDPQDQLTWSLDYLGLRIREIDMFAVMVQMTPGYYPYEPARDYLAAPVLGVVPRLLWPSKPVLDSGYRFAARYLAVSGGTYTAAAVPPAADLYGHGGVVVVVMGMFALGALARLVDRTLHPGRDLRLAIIYFPLFLTLTKSEADITSLIASLPVQLLTAVVVCRLAFRTSSTPEYGDSKVESSSQSWMVR